MTEPETGDSSGPGGGGRRRPTRLNPTTVPLPDPSTTTPDSGILSTPDSAYCSSLESFAEWAPGGPAREAYLRAVQSAADARAALELPPVSSRASSPSTSSLPSPSAAQRQTSLQAPPLRETSTLSSRSPPSSLLPSSFPPSLLISRPSSPPPSPATPQSSHLSLPSPTSPVAAISTCQCDVHRREADAALWLTQYPDLDPAAFLESFLNMPHAMELTEAQHSRIMENGEKLLRVAFSVASRCGGAAPSARVKRREETREKAGEPNDTINAKREGPKDQAVTTGKGDETCSGEGQRKEKSDSKGKRNAHGERRVEKEEDERAIRTNRSDVTKDEDNRNIKIHEKTTKPTSAHQRNLSASTSSPQTDRVTTSPPSSPPPPLGPRSLPQDRAARPQSPLRLPLPVDTPPCQCADLTGLSVTRLWLSGSTREASDVRVAGCGEKADLDVMVCLGQVQVTAVAGDVIGEHRDGGWETGEDAAAMRRQESVRDVATKLGDDAVKEDQLDSGVVEDVCLSETTSVSPRLTAEPTSVGYESVVNDATEVDRHDSGVVEDIDLPASPPPPPLATRSSSVRDVSARNDMTGPVRLDSGVVEDIDPPVPPSPTLRLTAEPSDRPGFILLRHVRRPGCRHAAPLTLSSGRVRRLLDSLGAGVSRGRRDQAGPAVTGTVKDLSTRSGRLAIDVVGCMPLSGGWPCREFATRARPSGRPLAELVRRLCRTSLIAVPVGFPGGRREQDEWRMSFSRHEYIVYRAMTWEQRRCLVVLKYCRAALAGPAASVKSYYLKTALLWHWESAPEDSWTLPRLYDTLLELLQFIEDAVFRRYMPCYFLTDINLLATRSPSELLTISAGLRTMRDRLLSSLLALTSSWAVCDVSLLGERCLEGEGPAAVARVARQFARAIPPQPLVRQPFDELLSGLLGAGGGGTSAPVWSLLTPLFHAVRLAWLGPALAEAAERQRRRRRPVRTPARSPTAAQDPAASCGWVEAMLLISQHNGEAAKRYGNDSWLLADDDDGDGED